MSEDQTEPTESTHSTAQEEDDDSPTYEQAREELVDVVARLERGGTTLEESLALWERGEQLARICQEWLDGARERLDAVLEEDDSDEHDQGS